MNISVIGTGYVGLVTGTCLAETGNEVICVDNDSDKVKKLQDGKITIYEPQLEMLFYRNTKQGNLRFTTDIAAAVKSASVIFLALPTPSNEDGSADLSAILAVAAKIAPLIDEYKVIVDKSTVPVGTCEKVRAVIGNMATSEFDVVSNPEFLREGFAVDDFMKPERVIVGCSSEKAKATMTELFNPFVRQGNPIIFMDERSAELTKYAANVFLATKISFMNEIANICERLGANVDAVRMGIGSDSRIGRRFLFSGIGYGGSCFPKDVKALAHSAEEAGYDFRILRAVMAVNEQQRMEIIKKITAHFGDRIGGIKIAVWGLSFKPDTDDIREAPALYIIRELLQKGALVSAYDPEAMENVKKQLGNTIHYANNAYGALDRADALLIATEWSVFRTPDFKKMSEKMKSKVIFDGRNLYEIKQMEHFGFCYYSIGRRSVNAPAT